MAHLSPDFKTKKAFKEAVASGKAVYAYHPGPFGGPSTGVVTIEAPAEYHKWYARAEIKDGRVVKVVS